MCHGPTLLRAFGTPEGFTANYHRLSEALFVLGLSPESLLELLKESPRADETSLAHLRADAVDALTLICERNHPAFKFELTKADVFHTFTLTNLEPAKTELSSAQTPTEDTRATP